MSYFAPERIKSDKSTQYIVRQKFDNQVLEPMEAVDTLANNLNSKYPMPSTILEDLTEKGSPSTSVNDSYELNNAEVPATSGIFGGSIGTRLTELIGLGLPFELPVAGGLIGTMLAGAGTFAAMGFLMNVGSSVEQKIENYLSGSETNNQ